MTYIDTYSQEFLLAMTENLKRRRQPFMAGAATQHGILTAGQVKTVTLSAPFSRVIIFNRTGVDEIFFTTDQSDPTVGGDNTLIVPAAIWAEVVDGIHQGGGNNTVIKLISQSAVEYSVIGQ